jgi:predicted Fe-Mo cluster-binding NifX family protein
MLIAVSAQGETLDSPVDARFGRAPAFVLVDTESEMFKCVPNTQNLQAAQGAGIQSAQSVVNAGAKVLITGNCGPKAFRALSAAGVQVYVGAGGTVREVLQKYREGTLQQAQDANVEGHW